MVVQSTSTAKLLAGDVRNKGGGGGNLELCCPPCPCQGKVALTLMSLSQLTCVTVLVIVAVTVLHLHHSILVPDLQHSGMHACTFGTTAWVRSGQSIGDFEDCFIACLLLV